MWRESPELYQLPLITRDVDIHARTVTGAMLKVLGQIEVTFLLGEDRFPFKAYVVDNSMYQAILGRDFLHFFKAKIDLDQGTLEMEPWEAYRHHETNDEDNQVPGLACAVYSPKSWSQ